MPEKKKTPKPASKKAVAAKSPAGKVTADTPIMELVMNHPKAVSVLMDYGFHCIGCQLSAYESLGQGAAAHGMDEAQIKKMVSEINKIIESG